MLGNAAQVSRLTAVYVRNLSNAGNARTAGDAFTGTNATFTPASLRGRLPTLSSHHAPRPSSCSSAWSRRRYQVNRIALEARTDPQASPVPPSSAAMCLAPETSSPQKIDRRTTLAGRRSGPFITVEPSRSPSLPLLGSSATLCSDPHRWRHRLRRRHGRQPSRASLPLSQAAPRRLPPAHGHLGFFGRPPQHGDLVAAGAASLDSGGLCSGSSLPCLMF